MARPRERAIDLRLFDAWSELSAELPYDQISLAAIAERAGVGRPSLYRRYASKAELAFAAGIARSVPLPHVDRGSLREDLLAGVEALTASLHAMPREVYADQLSVAIGDAAFARKVQDEYAEPALRLMLAMWDRALARGEVDPGVDGRTALNDLAGALIFEVMVRHGSGDPGYRAALVDRFVRGVRPSA